MKSVLLSTRPKWCEKICHEIGKDENGKPIYEIRIEVRKTAPKEVPFKVYIYCSYGNDRENYMLGKRGKVIGEFICDRITDISVVVRNCNEDYNHVYHNDECKGSCLTWKELQEYGKGKPLYGWHISDLKIYDKPKELSEFRKPFTPKKLDIRKFIIKNGINNIAPEFKSRCDFCDKITRPPQSWCYVESLGE